MAEVGGGRWVTSGEREVSMPRDFETDKDFEQTLDYHNSLKQIEEARTSCAGCGCSAAS
jgi:hypothetical protein